MLANTHKTSPTYKNASKEGKRRLDEVAAMSPLDRYFYWITERESIRLKKEAGESPPWTIDPILQNFRFCNVVRIQDKVSQWLYDNWYKPYFDHPNMILAIVLARHFNTPTTLEYIGFPEKWRPNATYNKLLQMKREFPGRSVFNGAYMIRSSSNSSPRFYPDKSEMVIKETVQQFVDNPLELDTSSMENAVEQIQGYRNFGSFMAGQVVADARWAITGEWADKNTWASVGPGSRRGMNMLHGREVEFPLKQPQFLKELREVMREARKTLPKRIVSRAEAIDYQNCFCEYFKVVKTLFNLGRMKQRYPGAKISQNISTV